jgi:ribosomal protein S6--L-glutamate ligase
MRLAILSTTLAEEEFLDSMQDFRRVAEERGHGCALVRHGGLGLAVGGALGELLWGEGAAELIAADLVIPRLNQRQLTRSDFYILDALECQGVAFLNPIAAIAAARSKITTQQQLHAAGLPVPATVLVRTWEGVEDALRLLPAGPWVVKPAMGSKGRDVALARTAAELRAVFALRWEADRHEILLIQEYLSTDAERPWDMRVLVLQGEVVGAMRREAPAGEFRANYSLGGTVAAVRPEPAIAALAVRAAETLDLDLAGVDILVSPDGPRILEVNANPGWEGISGAMAAAGEDFFGRFLSILESRA